jgi:hypothetical protein
MFFAPGLFLFLTGIRTFFQSRRARRLHERHAAELVEAPARYWELEVAAVTSGLDFGAVFPVPVYAVPRS